MSPPSLQRPSAGYTMARVSACCLMSWTSSKQSSKQASRARHSLHTFIFFLFSSHVHFVIFFFQLLVHSRPLTQHWHHIVLSSVSYIEILGPTSSPLHPLSLPFLFLQEKNPGKFHILKKVKKPIILQFQFSLNISLFLFGCSS